MAFFIGFPIDRVDVVYTAPFYKNENRQAMKRYDLLVIGSGAIGISPSVVAIA